jgi:hypothetical protein
MAQAKITIKDSSLYVGGKRKADFNKEAKALTEFYNGGAEMAAELLQFLKKSEFGWEDEEISDTRIENAKNIWEIHPEAPKPTRKHLGDKSPNVSEWVQKNHPNTFRIRYPYGIWNKHEAGMGRCLSPFRDETNNKISKEAWERLNKEEGQRLEDARRVIKEAELG